MVWQTQLSLSQLQTRHYLHLLNATIWYILIYIWWPSFIAKPCKGHSPLWFFPPFFLNNEFAQLPAVYRFIMSNWSGQWRWRLNQKWFQWGITHCSAAHLINVTNYVCPYSLVWMQARRSWYSWSNYPLKPTGPPFITFIKAGADKHLNTYSTQYEHTPT